MSEVLSFFVLILLLAFVGAFLYKFRAQIKKWTNDPDYGSTWHPDRRTILARRKEDCDAELEYLDNKDEKEREKSNSKAG